MRKRSERGFTLIEITAVLILIAALLAIVIPNYSRAIEKGRVTAVRTQLAAYESMLEDYKLENHMYPTTEQGLETLHSKPTSPPIPDTWDGPYAKKEIGRDPWETAYVYRCPGEQNKDGYDLFSTGTDHVEGGTGFNADIWLENK